MIATTAPQRLTCKSCGRSIISLRSLREAGRNGGYGRGCARKNADNAAALAATVKPAQVTKAIELVEDGAITRVRRGAFKVVSSNGGTTYLVSREACTCPAGLRAIRCYHRIAVEILAPAPKTAPAVIELAAPADPFANIYASIAA